MGMSTENDCGKSKLNTGNLQCCNMAQSLQVILFSRVSTQQCCCPPSQADYCYDNNASEPCYLKMCKIKMMNSLIFSLVISSLSLDRFLTWLDNI